MPTSTRSTPPAKRRAEALASLAAVARRAAEAIDDLAGPDQAELATSELLQVEVVALEAREFFVEARVLLEQRECRTSELLTLGAQPDEVRDTVLADQRRRRHGRDC